MSQTLGEKLRQARDERGISIAEVAEQTRISPHYLELIEQDDYRTLPGGIFNKGFVKSYAKYVGVDEAEALQDYARLISSQTNEGEDELKTYRPEVLTDDNSSSNFSTIIFAVIILGLMSAGIYYLVNYIQNNPNALTTSNTNSSANTNSANTNSNVSTANTNTAAPIPSVNEIKVEFKALTEKVSVEATVDGKKISKEVLPETPEIYTGQQSVKLRYYRGYADKVQFTLNGKQIASPPAPAKGNGIEFEINKENIVQILQSGQVAPPATNANTATPR